MRDSCSELDCFCGTCDSEKVTYNIWKDLTAESDQYGQQPNCEAIVTGKQRPWTTN